jgi:hypothetical protein
MTVLGTRTLDQLRRVERRERIRLPALRGLLAERLVYVSHRGGKRHVHLNERGRNVLARFPERGQR